jgi:hypothetical protein
VDIHLKWVVGVCSLFAAGLAYRQWFAGINLWLKSVRIWAWNVISDKKTCHVVETFFLESAVLWFVFPLLDSLYDPTRRGTPSPLLNQAYIAAFVFLLVAVILSHAGKDG